MSYVVKKNIIEWGKARDFHVSAEVFGELSKMVEAVLVKSKSRAEANGRLTIKVRDL